MHRWQSSKNPKETSSLGLLKIWATLVVYLSLFYLARPVSIIVSIANALSLKTVYILADQGFKTSDKLEKALMGVLVAKILYSLAVTSAVSALGVAIIGELQLLQLRSGFDQLGCQSVLLYMAALIQPVLVPIPVVVDTAAQDAFSVAYAAVHERVSDALGLAHT